MDPGFDRLDTDKDGDVDINEVKQPGVRNVSK
jgi:hypothetical protein